MEDRKRRVRREVEQKHPEFSPEQGDEITFSCWGAELFVHVWIGGKNVARYEDVVDDLEAALTHPGSVR